MKKKLLSVLLCTAMAVSLITGCGSSGKTEPEAPAAEVSEPEAETPEAEPESETETANTEEKELGGTLTVATTFANEPQLPAVQEAMDGFTAETGIKIDLIVPGDDYESQLKTMMASNSLPDVWETHGWSLLRYGEYLQKVNDQPWFDSMDTEMLGGTMADEDGNFYALGITGSFSGLIYNADVLEKAGVDIADLTTWEELEAACEKIKAIGATPIVVGGAVSGNLAGLLGSLAPAFWTDEGAVVDGSAALKDGTFDFDTYGTELYQYFADHFVKKGYLNEDALTMDSTAAQQALGAGEAAFMFRGVDNISVAKEYYPDANLGILPVPASQEGAKPSWRIGEGLAYGVWKDTENPDAAWALLEYLARPEVASKLAIATGGTPAIEGMEVGENFAWDAIVAAEEFVGDNDQYDNIFDRAYFPSGMWGPMGQSVAMLIDNPDDVTEAVEFLRDNYTALYSEENQ